MRDGDYGVELPSELLIDLKFLKGAAIHDDFPEIGIQPDHNGRCRKAEGQGTQAENRISNGLPARDDRMKKYGVSAFFQHADNAVFFDIAVES